MTFHPITRHARPSLIIPVNPDHGFRNGCVVDVNIGQNDQAYAILHGELEHDDINIQPYLLVSWLYWEQDSEPVYQTDYELGSDEVMPSDELDMIPYKALNGYVCGPGQLPRSEQECTDDCPIFWRRGHVYLSAEATVIVMKHHHPVAHDTDEPLRQPIDEAVAQPPYVREPETSATVAAIWARASKPLYPQNPNTRQPRYNDPDFQHRGVRQPIHNHAV